MPLIDYALVVARKFAQEVVVPVEPTHVWNQLFPVVNQIESVTITHAENWMMRATVNVTLMSWGEHITINVGQHPQGSVVHIESKCAMPVQLVDWGRNKKNVDHIVRGLTPPTAA